MAINIKPENKGKLHKKLGIAEDKKIPAKKLAIKSTDSPATVKQKTFAKNARKWKKGDAGAELTDGSPFPLPYLKAGINDYINNNGNPPITYNPNDNGTALPTPTILPQQSKINTNNTYIPGSDVTQLQNKDPQWYNQVQNTYNNNQKAKQKFDKSLMSQAPKKPTGNGPQIAQQAIFAVDALIPPERTQRYYNRPEDILTYNQNQYGTGSEALMKNGGKVKGKKMPDGGFISSDQSFTTAGVNNLLGVTDNWFSGISKTGMELGDAATGGTSGAAMSLLKGGMKNGGGIKKMPNGGTTTAQPSSITNQNRTDWNSYVDWLNKQGVAGKPQLDSDSTGFKMLDQYRKLNPNTTISQNEITPIQQDLQNYRTWALDNISANKGTFAQGTNADNFMSGLSQADGYPGSKTTSYKFPDQYLKTFDNGKQVANQNLGFATAKKNGGEVEQYHTGGAPGLGGAMYGMTNGVGAGIPKKAKDKNKAEMGGFYSIGNVKFPKSKSKNGELHADNGAQMQGNNLMDDVTPHWGGNIEQLSPNMFDGGTMQFNGDSHEQGGIGIQYGKKPIEVEGDENAFKDSQNNLQIMGNMKNPVTGNKFKVDAKALSDKELKAQKLIDTGSSLVNNSNPKDKFERLSFNAGNIMSMGGAMKQKEIASSKEHMADIQNAMLDMANEQGVKPDKLFSGKAKFGAKIAAKTSGDKMINGKKIKAFYPNGGGVDGTDSYPQGDPRANYEVLRQNTLKDLQAKYPGQKVDVVYNGLGGVRTQGQQQDIASQPNSISPSFSMHNVDAARDFDLVVNGKTLNSSSPDYSILHNNAKSLGLFPLSGNAGQKDPYHVGLVQEGLGHTAADLFSKYPQAKNWDASKNYFSQLEPIVQSGQATPAQLKAYRAYSGQNANYQTSTNTPTGQLIVPTGQQLVGEDLQARADGTSSTDPTFNNLTSITPDQQAKMDNYTPLYNPQTVATGTEQAKITNPSPLPTKDDTQPLGLSEIAPELYTLATNRRQAVQMQKFAPQMYEPYQVSYQDQINQNNSQFNNLQKQLAYDPTALSTLAGQQYSANNTVQASQFRENQQINNDIINKNVELLNNSKLKNLELADTQYTRQTDAIANTKMQNREALISISDKIAQQKATNRNIQLYGNLYPYYQFNKQTGQTEYIGPKGAEAADLITQTNPTGTPAVGDDTRTTVTKNPDGSTKLVKYSTPGTEDQTKEGLGITKLKRSLFFNTSIPKLYKSTK